MVHPRRYLPIILSIACKSLGTICSKYAAVSISGFLLFSVITNTFYLLSLVCLAVSMIFWQEALRYYPLSVAYPFQTLVNFIVLAASVLLFDEGITAGNIIGLILISAGITIATYRYRGDACSFPSS